MQKKKLKKIEFRYGRHETAAAPILRRMGYLCSLNAVKILTVFINQRRLCLSPFL